MTDRQASKSWAEALASSQAGLERHQRGASTSTIHAAQIAFKNRRRIIKALLEFENPIDTGRLRCEVRIPLRLCLLTIRCCSHSFFGSRDMSHSILVISRCSESLYSYSP